MENSIQNQPTNKPKIYDPGWYDFIIFLALIGALIFSGGIFFCLIPAFIMSLHNAKIIQNGAIISKRMKTYLWLYISYFIAELGLFGWSYFVLVKWLANQPMFIADAILGFNSPYFRSMGPALAEASAQGGTLWIASSISHYSTYILWLPILVLIFLVHSFTTKNELPVFKELRKSEQADRKSPIPPIALTILVAALFIAGSTFALAPITKYLLKDSFITTTSTKTNTVTEKSAPNHPTVPTSDNQKQPVTSDATISKEVYRINVLCDLPLSIKQENLAYYENSYTQGIITDHFPEKNCKPGPVEVSLVSFGHMVTTEEVIKALDEQNFRPGTLMELLALGASYPELLSYPSLERSTILVAIGSSWQRQNGELGSPVLFTLNNERRLDLNWYEPNNKLDENKWDAGRQFLAIHK